MKIKYFAINLESNAQRRKHMINQARIADIDLKIFKAVTPNEIDKIPHLYNPEKTRRFLRRPLIPTEIACGLSHITLWRNLLKDLSTDYYLVLEDDVYIKPDIKNIIKSIDFSFVSFLKLNGLKKPPMKAIQRLAGSYTLYRFAYALTGARAYLINKKAAKSLIKYCETLHAPIDILMARSYDHGMPIYAVLPYPVQIDTQHRLGTDIGEKEERSGYVKGIRAIEKLSARYLNYSNMLKKKRAEILLNWQVLRGPKLNTQSEEKS